MEIKETPKDRAIKRLNEVYNNFRTDGSSGRMYEYDDEGAHIAAENIIMDFLHELGYDEINIIMDFLHELGYDEVIDKFEELVDKIGFWYA